MSELDLNVIRQNLQHKSTQELVDTLTFHLEDYDARVIEIVEEIILARGLLQSDIDRAKSDYKAKKQKEATTPQKKSYWNRIAISLLIGIPLMLLGRWVGGHMGRMESEHQAAKADTPWSAEYTESLSKGLYAGFMEDTPDSTNNKLLASCTIEKLRAKYPHGIESIDKDSMKLVIRAYAKECLIKIPVRLYWNYKLDSTLRTALINKTWMQKVKENYRKPLCDCYVDRFKEMYPNGFTTADYPDSVRDDILIPCVNKISHHK